MKQTEKLLFQAQKVKEKAAANEAFQLKFLQSTKHQTLLLIKRLSYLTNDQFKLEIHMYYRMAEFLKIQKSWSWMSMILITPFPESLIFFL